MLRRGSAGSNTAADHVAVVDAAIAALPPGLRRKLMVTCDGAGASHDLIRHPGKLASRRGYELTCSVGWAPGEREKAALRLVPARAWQLAIDGRGEIRERRADDACASSCCAHRACRIEEAHVTELTGLLRPGPGKDQLKAWPAAMRVFARRERPHPGAQLTLFEAGDGWRIAERTVTVTPRPSDNSARVKGGISRMVPASAELMRLYADYLAREYGSPDSDYVFVSLWAEPRGHPLTYACVCDLVLRLRRRAASISGLIFTAAPTPHGCCAKAPGWRA
jgi:hypothetical protein